MVLSKDLKKAICFGLIVGCIISIFQLVGYCVESESVEFSYVGGVGILPSGDTGTIITSSTGGIYYVEIEPGYLYTINNDLSASLNCGFFDDIVVGSSVDVFSVEAYGTKTFTANEINYLYVGRSTSGTVGITITREAMPGMTAFIDNLAYDLSYANLNGVVSFVVPIMAISILFALGFYFIKRIINKFKKAKGGI